MKDNLQEIADGIRAELRRMPFGSWSIAHPSLKDPIDLDVAADGISWIVRVKCGERVLFDIVDNMLCVGPEEFLSGLYVVLRGVIKALTTPAPKPS